MTLTSLALSGISWARRSASFTWQEPSMTGGYPYTLPELPYPYEALEPVIDTQTMKVHHQGHHGTYVSNLNKALEEVPAFQTQTLEELLTNLDKVPQPQRTTIRNNGGGHWNHTLWWKLLAPKPQDPSPSLQKRIASEFESWNNFRSQLLEAAAKHFGSGWAWLILTPTGKLRISTTPNQDNPLMPYAEVRGKPVLGIDVWEHAYYLKYQNRRVEYLANIWQRINWEYVEALLG